MEEWYFPLFAVLSTMLFSCFYNLITLFLIEKDVFWSCLSDKGQGCHQTSLAAALPSVRERKCKRSLEKPSGYFLCSSLYPIYSLCLFHPLWVVKCSLIFCWSTWGPIDFCPHQDSAVATCRLLLTLAVDNLTKHGTDEKAYEFFLSPHIMSNTDYFWHLSLFFMCHGGLVSFQPPFAFRLTLIKMKWYHKHVYNHVNKKKKILRTKENIPQILHI